MQVKVAHGKSTHGGIRLPGSSPLHRYALHLPAVPQRLRYARTIATAAQGEGKAATKTPGGGGLARTYRPPSKASHATAPLLPALCSRSGP
jgi:hypothetical protein